MIRKRKTRNTQHTNNGMTNDQNTRKFPHHDKQRTTKIQESSLIMQNKERPKYKKFPYSWHTKLERLTHTTRDGSIAGISLAIKILWFHFSQRLFFWCIHYTSVYSLTYFFVVCVAVCLVCDDLHECYLHSYKYMNTCITETSRFTWSIKIILQVFYKQ